MGNEFNDLDMGLLIGGPLKAACEAQVLLSKSTADFITGVCMTGGENGGALQARTVDFSFDRVRFDEDKGEEVKEKVSLNVPMLAVVKVPALGVEDVDISFDMEGKSSEASKDSKTSSFDADVTAKIGFAFFHSNIHIKGSVTTSKENTRTTDKSAKYHVQVKAKQGDLPEGLSRVLDILSSSIKPSVAEAKSAS